MSVLLAMMLIAASVIDAKSRRLPDWLTLPLAVAGVWLGIAEAGWEGLWEHSLGALLGYAAFWIVRAIYRRSTGAHGLGLGDAKLLAAAGAWLGPMLLAPVVFVSAALALLFAIVMQIGGRQLSLRSTLPFGPFLSIGFAAGWAAYIAGWG